MQLLLLLNGNKNTLMKMHGLDAASLEIIKIDEKKLASPKSIINILKTKKYEKVYFGCIELELQRFRIFMKIYLFLSHQQGEIIDESGNKDKYTIIKLFFKELPNLATEIISGAAVIPCYYVKYYFFKWIYTKN